MQKNALARALSVASLSDAWLDISKRASPRSRNTIGVDGISIADFRLDEKTRLARLSRAFRNREFQFNPLRPQLIPKANGKDRLICVPTVQDRIVQRALLNFLSDLYEHKLANTVSYGFIRKRGVKKAASDACRIRHRHPWVFKTDITSFFDSIDRKLLYAAVRKLIRERSLHELLFQAASCEIQAGKGNQQKRINRLGVHRGAGLRQGMPLSPFFSNVMLMEFDKSIQARGLAAVRYADDLIFFADSNQECVDIAAFCAEQLHSLGLEVPSVGPNSKSVIYTPDESAEFLGVELAPFSGEYRLEIAKAQIARIRDDLLSFGSIDELLAREITLPRLGTVLTQRRNGYLAAYDMCDNVNVLELALAELEQRVLKKIYQDGLKINLTELSRAARTFLGLH